MRGLRHGLSLMGTRVKVRTGAGAQWARERGSALLAWIMVAIVWRLLTEDIWKQTRRLVKVAWSNVRDVHALRSDLLLVQGVLEGTEWVVKLTLTFNNPKLEIHLWNVSLFSDLQPMFDLFITDGFTVGEPLESVASKLRWWSLLLDGRKVCEVTASLSYDAQCLTVETGETKPVLKFLCPGDPEYADAAIAAGVN